MTHPTTAGVLASFASLGDVIVAEPGALLVFAGPRVVQQTTREKLPDDFGLAESNSRFGHVDAIVRRPDLRPFLGRLLSLFADGRRWPMSPASTRSSSSACASGSRSCATCRCSAASASPGELARLERQIERIAAEPTADEVWHSVELARHQDRPYTLDYVERLFDDFIELHGDRSVADDPAIVAGLGRFQRADRSCSSATRRAATSASARSGTSACPTPRATARRCA